MLLDLPVFSSTLQFSFKGNKKNFHKIYAVRISFKTEYYKYEDTHQLMCEWINHHNPAFNRVWLQPEFCPTSRRVHYHGFVDIKDQFRLNKFLRLFKEVGSFHLETIKTTLDEYLSYCTKEVGITEACEYQYKRYLWLRRHNLAKPHKERAQKECVASA